MSQQFKDLLLAFFIVGAILSATAIDDSKDAPQVKAVMAAANK